MKLLHLSDLHLGKRVNEFSMLEDQSYILNETVGIADKEQPDAILIAGDIYDKSIPPAEAVQLFDDFLCRIAGRGIKVLMISGNHDSPERIAFGGRLMEQSGIYISPVYDGTSKPVVLSDMWGDVCFYMLPFIKPAHVRRFYPDENIESYTDAVCLAVKQMNLNENVRNVLLTHQFVTGAARCDSEEISVGGSDNVDASVFGGFDYTALGHIHGPQNIGRETVRYCGSPLKYSFSEAGHKKSVTVIELKEKGNVSVRTVPLVPLHDMREIKGSYMEITAKPFYDNTKTDDYIHITLTDEEDIPNAVGKLRAIYKNLMKLDYDNARTRGTARLNAEADADRLSPSELFAKFYREQNNRPMSEEQSMFISKLTEQIWEENK